MIVGVELDFAAVAGGSVDVVLVMIGESGGEGGGEGGGVGGI